MNTEIQTQSETVSESEALVLREDNEGLVTLTLNRPRQFNALSEEVLAALQEELDRIAEDQQARLVVIAGNGKAFCAGHDLKQMSAKREEDYYRTLFKQCSKMMLTLNQAPTGDRQGPGDSHGGRVPAGGRLRPRSGCR